MDAKMYGYVRVSSRDQNEERQLLAMRDFGVSNERIYVEKQSGKDFNRPVYQRILAQMKKGDVFVIKSIDRLGRNYDEIIEQWRTITKEKQVATVVLDMPLLDTRQGRDLTSTLIADIVLQLLSYVAQTEREFIHQRQREGIAAAQAKGVRFGAKPKERPPIYSKCVTEWKAGDISSRQAGENCGVDHKTFLRWVKQDEKHKQQIFNN